MKSSQAIIVDKSKDQLKDLSKKDFIKYLKKYCNITPKTEKGKKVNLENITYKKILEYYKLFFTKEAEGIYSLSTDNENIDVVCLIDKTMKEYEENYEGKKEGGNKIMKAKQKLVKRASVMALATVVGCGIFGCQKKTEPIIPEVSVRVEETLDNDGDTIREVESVIGKERKSYIEESSVAKEEARGKTVENTKRTVNEYGITIYGKQISENEAVSKGLNSEIGIENDKERGIEKVYTEYYSDAYGGIVYISTIKDNGSIKIYDENGNSFIAGKKLQNDIEVALSNYRMGNAMAEAIDKTYKK